MAGNNTSMEAGSLTVAMLCFHSYPLGRLGTTDTGGMSTYIREAARELGKRGYAVDIYTRARSSEQQGALTIGENVRLIHIKAGDGRYLSRLALYPYIEEFIEGMEAFRSEAGLRYDVVHSHYWLSGCAGRWARENWCVPHVIMFHTTGAAKNAFSPKPAEHELRLLRERELVEDCDLIIAPTEREKQQLIEFYGADSTKVTVIHGGVNLDRFQPIDQEEARRRIGLANGEAILLCVSRMDPIKGIDRLLAAAALLKGRLHFKLLVVGGDDSPNGEQKRLQDMVRTLGIEESVIFTGSLPQEELPFYYSAADVLVLPSHYESFGMVGLESLACGTPVVATEVGIHPHVLNDGPTGRLVTDARSDLLAEKIAELLSDRGDGKSVPSEIRKAVTRFTWDSVADALVAEYKRLMEREGALMIAGLHNRSETKC